MTCGNLLSDHQVTAQSNYPSQLTFHVSRFTSFAVPEAPAAAGGDGLLGGALAVLARVVVGVFVVSRLEAANPIYIGAVVIIRILLVETAQELVCLLAHQASSFARGATGQLRGLPVR